MGLRQGVLTFLLNGPTFSWIPCGGTSRLGQYADLEHFSFLNLAQIALSFSDQPIDLISLDQLDCRGCSRRGCYAASFPIVFEVASCPQLDLPLGSTAASQYLFVFELNRVFVVWSPDWLFWSR